MSLAPDGQRFLVTTELEDKATPLITLIANSTDAARTR
jgi:hypothetical protein